MIESRTPYFPWNKTRQDELKGIVEIHEQNSRKEELKRGKKKKNINKSNGED